MTSLDDATATAEVPFSHLGVPQTIRAMLEGWDADKMDIVAFNERREDSYASVTYGQVLLRVKWIGNVLLKMGVRRGDCIGLLAENRVEWPLTYLAVSSIGATVVSLDIFLKDRELTTVVETCKPRMIFTSSKYFERVVEASQDWPWLEHVVCFDQHERLFASTARGAEALSDRLGRIQREEAEKDRPFAGEAYLYFDSLQRIGNKLLERGTDLFADAMVEPDDVASMIFLSTTVGVELTHRGMMANLVGWLPEMGLEDSLQKRWLALLPFVHAWPTVCGLLFPLFTYSTVTILATTKLNDIFATLKERNIDYVQLVPLMVERIYQGIYDAAKADGIFVGIDLPAKATASDWFDQALTDAWRRSILTSTMERLGLSGLRCAWSAGAHLFRSAAAKTKKVGLNVLDAYGLTETSPIITHSTPTHNRMGSAGRPIPTVQVRIDTPDKYGNGEICAKGEVLMAGYYKDPEATHAAFDKDGWFHTGDIGLQDEDGFVYITGRCKDIIVNQGGKNIYPQEVEAAIGQSELVADVAVVPKIHNDREFPYAIVQVDQAVLAAHEQQSGRRLADKQVRALIWDEMQKAKSLVSHFKLPESFEVTFDTLDREAQKSGVLMFEESQPAECSVTENTSEDADQALSDVDTQIVASAIADYLAATVPRVTTTDAAQVDRSMSFFGYLSSLDLVEISSLIEREAKIKLYPTMLFEHINILALSSYFASEFRQEFTSLLGEDLPKASANPRVATRGGHNQASPRPLRPRAAAKPQDDPIAIVGLAGRFPGANSPEALWQHLEAGHDLITEIPKDRFDWQAYFGDALSEANKMGTKFGGFIDDIDKFDAPFFGIAKKEARYMDPQQRILLETVWKAIEDSGHAPASLAGSNVGVFAGVTTYDYLDIIRHTTEEVAIHLYTGTFPSVLPHRISYLLGLHGPSEVVDTACSSALVAIHRAKQAILAGECEMAIAGGVNALLTPEIFISFSRAGMLSPDGRCKTFSSDANGYVRAEGVGAVVLKPLSMARQQGDPIYGVIKGTATNHGGRASSFTSPNPNAQAMLVAAAIEDAGIDPESISYIEAHGTGTPLGDPIEINGLKKAFKQLYERRGQAPTKKRFCGVGSVKSNIGHLESAAGIAGVVKVLLAMKHGRLPPSIHVRQQSEYIELEDSPFYIVKELQPWQRPADKEGRELRRRAGVSSFGVGGANAHVVIEEPPAQRTVQQSEDVEQVAVLSAKKEDRLIAYAKSMADHLDTRMGNGGASLVLRDLAYTLQCGRDAMQERLAIVAASVDEVQAKLAAFAAGEPVIEGLYRGSVPAQGVEPESVATSSRPRQLRNAELARIWVHGGAVDWALLHRDARPKRVSLPTYPFARQRVWIRATDR